MDIQKLRKKLKLNQSDLAQILNVHHTTVSKWERGILSPSFYHRDLLFRFESYDKKDIKQVLVLKGAVDALITLLT